MVGSSCPCHTSARSASARTSVSAVTGSQGSRSASVASMRRRPGAVEDRDDAVGTLEEEVGALQSTRGFSPVIRSRGDEHAIDSTVHRPEATDVLLGRKRSPTRGTWTPPEAGVFGAVGCAGAARQFGGDVSPTRRASPVARSLGDTRSSISSQRGTQTAEFDRSTPRDRRTSPESPAICGLCGDVRIVVLM